MRRVVIATIKIGPDSTSFCSGDDKNPHVAASHVSKWENAVLGVVSIHNFFTRCARRNERTRKPAKIVIPKFINGFPEREQPIARTSPTVSKSQEKVPILFG